MLFIINDIESVLYVYDYSNHTYLLFNNCLYCGIINLDDFQNTFYLIRLAIIPLPVTWFRFTDGPAFKMHITKSHSS